MSSTILVTGGTGTLGRLVVPLLSAADRKVRVLSRQARPGHGEAEPVTGDLSTGEGVEAAVDGVDTIVHLAGTPKGDEHKARNLVEAASRRASSPHLVYISVVGADRIPASGRLDRAMFGYYPSKAAAERVIEGSGLPWTTLRTTQFHDLLLMVAAQLARLPVVPVPAGFRFQPVDTAEVAARLVELALGRPSGLVREMGGPRVYEAGELVRGYLHATGRRRPVVPVRVPGAAARAFREGVNLTPDGAVGRRTWEDFLAERLRTGR